jgi:hypothetical protein
MADTAIEVVKSGGISRVPIRELSGTELHAVPGLVELGRAEQYR